MKSDRHHECRYEHAEHSWKIPGCSNAKAEQQQRDDGKGLLPDIEHHINRKKRQKPGDFADGFQKADFAAGHTDILDRKILDQNPPA